MRCLRKASRLADHSTWEGHQRRQLAKALDGFNFGDPEFDENKPECAPLFPGSMLFNQLLIPESGDAVIENVEIQEPVSLDSVYESLGVSQSVHTSANLLVDCPVLTQQSIVRLASELVTLLRKHKTVDTLVMINQPLPLNTLTEDLSRKIQVVVVQPQWCSPANLLAWYRNARHCLFVDSHRVLDAVFAQNDCTLIASKHFISGLTTSALKDYVDGRENCRAYWEIEPENTGVKPAYSVIQNRRSDLERALRRSVTNDKTQPQVNHWLLSVSSAKDDAVIKPSMQQSGKLQRLQDQRISGLRKWQKLRENPRGFCADSRFFALRALSNWLPKRRVVCE